MADSKKITLTYLNIRQSIAVLLAKIISIDILMAILVIASYFILITGSSLANYNSANTMLFLSIFILLGVIKILFNSYVILLRLNEYYEIRPESIAHRKGIFFKKTELYDINKVRSINIQDSFLGEMFNYATITVYDLRFNKYLDMYLIHNANRYARVLKELLPHLEIKEDKTRFPILPKDELVESEE